MDASHFLSFRRSPLYLVQRWLLRHDLKLIGELEMWRVNTVKACESKARVKYLLYGAKVFNARAVRARG